MSNIYKLFGNIKEKLRIHKLPSDDNPSGTAYVVIDAPTGNGNYQTRKVALNDLGVGAGSSGKKYVELHFPTYLQDEVTFGFFHASEAGSITEVSLSVIEAPTGSNIKVDLIDLSDSSEILDNTPGAIFPTINIGQFNSHTVLNDAIAFSGGDEFACIIKNVGTTDTGAYLTVRLTIE